MCSPRSICCKLCVVLVVILLSLQHAAEGQVSSKLKSRGAQRGATAAKGNGYVLLTYQVGDLVLNVPDYPYPGPSDLALRGVGMSRGVGVMGGGGIGGGMGRVGVAGRMGNRPDSAPAPARITMDDLERVLVTLVAPNTWAEKGGGEGELQQLGTSLVVRQTATVQQQISDLLEQLREGSGKRKTVAIDARWLSLDSDELDRLMPPDQDGRSEIDRTVLAEYTRRPSSIRGHTNCFTGQLVYIVSGTRRNVVTSFIPVVGSIDRPEERGAHYASLKGGANYVFTVQDAMPVGGVQSSFVGGIQRAVGYQPVIQNAIFGALLEIRPTVIPGDDTAIVDLRSTLTAPGEQSINPGAQPPVDPLTPTVDRVAIETQELATTLSVPLGQPILVGGLTYVSPSITSADQKGKADAGQAREAPTETPQLYLILQLR